MFASIGPVGVIFEDFCHFETYDNRVKEGSEGLSPLANVTTRRHQTFGHIRDRDTAGCAASLACACSFCTSSRRKIIKIRTNTRVFFMTKLQTQPLCRCRCRSLMILIDHDEFLFHREMSDPGCQPGSAPIGACAQSSRHE